MKQTIAYTAGYKYRLERSYRVATGITGRRGVIGSLVDPLISLELDGSLAIREGYCWDGPSGPSVDTKTFMRGSLVHDALYQLMRECQLPLTFRAQADALLRQICREDGMSWLRAWYVERAVSWFGESSAEPQRRAIEFAP